jgi:hypothetical protein
MAISVGEPVVSRERFWNLPNSITVLRTAAVPVLMLLPVFDDKSGRAVIACHESTQE